MKFGDKPLQEMSRDECLEAITELRSSREALRAEGVKKFKEAKLVREVKVAKKETVETNAEALRMLLE